MKEVIDMATSLCFHKGIQNLIPIEILEKYKILPITIKDDKLCLIAKRPLSDEGLIELRHITGFQDYELQLVGDDVIQEYIRQFKIGHIFSEFESI